MDAIRPSAPQAQAPSGILESTAPITTAPQAPRRQYLYVKNRAVARFFLFLSYSSCFVGFQFGIPDSQVGEVFLCFRRDDAGEAQESD